MTTRLGFMIIPQVPGATRLARHCFEQGLNVTPDSLLCRAGLREVLVLLGDTAALKRQMNGSTLVPKLLRDAVAAAAGEQGGGDDSALDEADADTSEWYLMKLLQAHPCSNAETILFFALSNRGSK